MNRTSNTATTVGNVAKIGVIGTGVMGVQICTVLLKAGHDVVMKTRFPENIPTTIERIAAFLSKSMTDEFVRTLLNNLFLTVDFWDLSDRDIIFEVVKEDPNVKIENLNAVSKVIKKDALVFSNSSSMNIDLLSEHVPNRRNFLGFHVFNPFEKMRLVEIVITPSTDATTIETAFQIAESLGKTPVLVKDSPGYIVNRLLFLQINEAIKMLDECISTKEDIDRAIKLGLNHPLGPLELADMIGLDTCLSILKILEKDLGDASYMPSSALERHVAEGRLGRKSGKGFYEYPRR